MVSGVIRSQSLILRTDVRVGSRPWSSPTVKAWGRGEERAKAWRQEGAGNERNQGRRRCRHQAHSVRWLLSES